MKAWFASDAGNKSIMSTKGVLVIFLAFLALLIFATQRWKAETTLNMDPLWNEEATVQHPGDQQSRKQPKPITLTCPTGNQIPVCQKKEQQTPSVSYPPKSQASPSCPEYFRWIHEDLRHWSFTGITKEMIESANRLATFRLVILDGRVYVEEYFGHGMTRNWFTLWSILQLLQRYPGRLPDLELVFSCMDMPVVKSADYRDTTPPPLFHYCKDNQTVDILFPDWSFWGCPEQNVRPWETVIKDIVAGRKQVEWRDRKPYAFWKGSKFMGTNRQDLMKCNVSKDQDWNARLYDQDWSGEAKQGYKKSNLADQCDYRYKIYVEGLSWSVSQKYILACDSPMLAVTTHYDEFLTRGLIPGQHYWPINENDKCKSIKFAVDWGNAHQEEAQAMGKKGSRFIQEEVTMDYIYDYMLHVLNQYAKLMKYKPTIPERATEICLESMACSAQGSVKEFTLESMVKWTYEEEPCTMPPPFSPVELNDFASRKADSIEQVKMWEQQSQINRKKRL